MNTLYDAFSGFLTQFSSIGFFDVLDIAIVSVIFYYIYRFVRDRRAGKLAVGILLVFVAMMVSNLLGMSLSYRQHRTGRHDRRRHFVPVGASRLSRKGRRTLLYFAQP